MGLGKPQLHAKFEVTSFSHSRNIIGDPQILETSSSPWPNPLFLLVKLDDGLWQTPAACQI